jgi:uncharacterized protein (DUF697 family)
MTDGEQQAILSVMLLAAFADGMKDRHERSRIRELVETLPGARSSLPRINADVMMRRASLREAAAELKSPESRRLAYAMAVSICDADGARSEVDVRFLESLAGLLALSEGETRTFASQATQIVSGTLSGRARDGAAGPASGQVAGATSERSRGRLVDARAGATPGTGDERRAAREALATDRSARADQASRETRRDSAVLAEASRISTAGRAAVESRPAAAEDSASDSTDALVLRNAVLAGALERMPNPMASIAILPLQMRMVQEIAKRNGRVVDRQKARELMNTVDVGKVGDYLGDIGRKLLGGLFRQAAGKGKKSAPPPPEGSSRAFTTTYALGRLAQANYGGPSAMDTMRLKASFAPLLDRATELAPRYELAIQEQARKGASLDMTKLIALVEDVR